MTLSEFKAWFEGYTEGLEAAPTKAQFDRIKEKVKLIDGAPVTYPVYVDRYWPQPSPWYGTHPWRTYTTYSANNGATSGLGQATSNVQLVTTVQNDAAKSFDSHAAMYALGKAEAVN